jgi:hypothetical protein
MTNIRDGGTIFIGVPQRSADFIPEGMRAEHISTYKADEVQARINRFSDPDVRIELRQIEWDSKKFLAVEVSVSSISFKYKITPSLILNSPTLDPLPREPMTPTTTWLGTEESKHSDGKRTRIEGATQPMPTRAVPPDPEASEKPVRRRFTAEYRLRILREADARAEAVHTLGELVTATESLQTRKVS